MPLAARRLWRTMLIAAGVTLWPWAASAQPTPSTPSMQASQAAVAMPAASSGVPSPQAPPAIEPLAWLTGCWAADGAEPGSVEQWLAPAAGTMFGMNRTVRAGRLSQFEFMAIRTTAEGRLLFIAWPGGRGETEFPLKQASADEVVFESPRQAFPNRVIYRRTGPRTMLGRIEGLANGVARTVDFPFTRTACEQR